MFFTTGEQNLFCLDAYTGELIKSFGKDGRIKVGLTPIPPVIYRYKPKRANSIVS